MSSYKNKAYTANGLGITIPEHSWEDFTFRRLAWFYGPERAARISNGEDPATEADRAAWARLGAAPHIPKKTTSCGQVDDDTICPVMAGANQSNIRP